jgi:hypothetical protein
MVFWGFLSPGEIHMEGTGRQTKPDTTPDDWLAVMSGADFYQVRTQLRYQQSFLTHSIKKQISYRENPVFWDVTP